MGTLELINQDVFLTAAKNQLKHNAKRIHPDVDENMLELMSMEYVQKIKDTNDFSYREILEEKLNWKYNPDEFKFESFYKENNNEDEDEDKENKEDNEEDKQDEDTTK